MLKETLLRTIQKFRMIEKGETLLVGVSGGCDSNVLLYLLADLASSWKLKLVVLHVNHQLRGKDSDQDEIFVRALAEKNKLPFFSTRVSVKELARAQKMSLEEAARCARYEFFERMIETKNAQKLALAHTLDDQAETVLMRIMSGTGLQGLQAIRPKRKLNGAYLIRPLIEISREEIRSHAKQKQIKFREDKTNYSLQFVRNKIRLKLIPLLEKEFNPQVKKALVRLTQVLDSDLGFLDEMAEEFYEQLVISEGKEQISFSKKSFLELKPSIQYRLIQRALQTLWKAVSEKISKSSRALSRRTSSSPRKVLAQKARSAVFEAKASNAELDFNHWNRFSGILMAEDQFKFQFPKELVASVSTDQIKLRHAKQEPISFLYSLELNQSIYISELNLTLSCEQLPSMSVPFPLRDRFPEKWLKPVPAGNGTNLIPKSDQSFEIFDGDILSFPLTIRSREAGDRLRPLGQAKSTKLKEVLINKRIPVEKRDRLPIILSNNQIAWVAGVTMSDQFKIGPKTEHFVKLSLKSENLS